MKDSIPLYRRGPHGSQMVVALDDAVSGKAGLGIGLNNGFAFGGAEHPVG